MVSSAHAASVTSGDTATRERPPAPATWVSGSGFDGHAPDTGTIAAGEASAAALGGVAPAPAPSGRVTRGWPEPGTRIELVGAKVTAEAWAPRRPPAEGGAPVSLYFHGMTSRAELECGVASGATRLGWLLCADGNLPYGGGFTWTNTGSMPTVEAALSSLRGRFEGLVSARGGALIGYSIGGLAAVHVLERSTEPWAGLVMINTEVPVPVALVERRGVKRVALVAVRGDRSTEHLTKTAKALARRGVDARFFSYTSRHGHFFDEESAQKLTEPIAWALGGEE